jgi:hypothetical protein
MTAVGSFLVAQLICSLPHKLTEVNAYLTFMSIISIHWVAILWYEFAAQTAQSLFTEISVAHQRDTYRAEVTTNMLPRQDSVS